MSEALSEVDANHSGVQMHLDADVHDMQSPRVSSILPPLQGPAKCMYIEYEAILRSSCRGLSPVLPAGAANNANASVNGSVDDYESNHGHTTNLSTQFMSGAQQTLLQRLP